MTRDGGERMERAEEEADAYPTCVVGAGPVQPIDCAS